MCDVWGEIVHKRGLNLSLERWYLYSRHLNYLVSDAHSVQHARCQAKLSVTYIKHYSWEKLLQQSNRLNGQLANSKGSSISCFYQELQYISEATIELRLGCRNDKVANFCRNNVRDKIRCKVKPYSRLSSVGRLGGVISFGSLCLRWLSWIRIWCDRPAGRTFRHIANIPG